MSSAQQRNLQWFKSSRSSESGNCVETKFGDGTVHIRDSKYQGDPAARPVITVTTEQWSQFLTGLTSPATPQRPRPTRPTLSTTTDADGNVTLRSNGVTLCYTPAEWQAFAEGVALGEFAAAA